MKRRFPVQGVPRGPIVLWLLLAGSVASAAQPHLQGRSVSAALRGLEDAGLQFLYSSELLPDDVLVRVEPVSKDRLEIARAILLPYGLTVRAVRPPLYAVVRIATGNQPLMRVLGRVLDAETGAAVIGARVELLPLGRVVWTDIAGRYAFEAPAANGYALRVTAADYASAEVRSASDIALQRTAIAEVVVNSSRYVLATLRDNNLLRVSGVTLAGQPSLGDDPVRALAHLPGVAQNGVSAESIVRGGEPNEVLISLDGFPLRQAFHLAQYQSPFSVIDASIVDHVDVFTGGFPVRYGNRLSGVFDIQTRHATATPQRAVGVSFFDVHARAGGTARDHDLQWLAAGRVSTLATAFDRFAVSLGRPDYADVFAKLSYRQTPQLRWTGALLGSRDALSIVEENRESAQLEGRAVYGWLRGDFQPNKTFAGSVWLGHSQLDTERQGTADNPDIATGAVDDRRSSQFWDLRGRMQWQWRDNRSLEAGIDWADEAAHYQYQSSVIFSPYVAPLRQRPAQQLSSTDLRPHLTRTALFAADRWRFSDRWTSELGLRAQYQTVAAGAAAWTFDPRVALHWALDQRTSLRLHWGRFHQSDEVQQLRVEDGVLQFPKAQQADHIVLALERQLAAGIGLRIEVFQKSQWHPRPRFENLLNPLALLPELAVDRTRLDPEEAEIRGVELSVVQEIGSWNYWVNASVAKAIDIFDTQTSPRGWDQRYGLAAGVDWQHGPWRLGAVLESHSGWPTTPLLRGADGSFVLGTRNADRLPPFTSIDVRAEYRRPLRLGSLSLALQVTNLTNRRNICCTEVDVDRGLDGIPALDAEPRKWLPVVPSLKIDWEF